jgi:hypothetical protein
MMKKKRLSREEALEEYLVYRRRVRELLDLAQIARDIKRNRYKPEDLLGRGPDRFSQTVGQVLVGLFASLIDRDAAALNIFDVWLVLFPAKKDIIIKIREEVRPHVELIWDYRSKIAFHANRNVYQYVNTYRKFAESHDEITAAMQKVMRLAAELMRDEKNALPNLRADVDPILSAKFPRLASEQIEGLKDYFLA